MYLSRQLDLNELLRRKSFFLFGPRATGKTSLIRSQLSEHILIIDLLRSDVFLRLSDRPWEIEEIIQARKHKDDYVVIDEVQKVPMLLDEVHRLIESEGIRFLLTGSSAKKLRANNVNLLAGRAWQAELFPLTMREIPDFSLERYLTYGGLPTVYLSDDPREELAAYVATYLDQEIKIEAAVRKIHAFTRFLQTAALTSGKMLRFTALSSDTGIPVTTVREYYQILEDTLIGFMLPAWTKTVKRKAISTAKFYFFDIGVMHQLIGVKALEPHSNLYGRAFEHFIAMELRAYLSYHRKHQTLSYWRSKNGQKVDFIIGDHITIEVKTAKTVSAKHLVGLKALKEEGICEQYFFISFDKVERVVEGIRVMHWQDFLNALWGGEIVS